MDLNPLLQNLTLPTAPLPAGAVAVLKLVAGDISQLPTGQLVPATVVKAAKGETVLSLAGQQVTVKGTVNVPPGEVLRVRVEPGAKPAVAVVGREQTTTGAPVQNASRSQVPAQTPPSVPTPAGEAPTTPTSPRRGEVGSGAVATDPGEGPPTKANLSPAGFASLTAATSPQRGEVRVVTSTAQPPTPTEPVVADVIAREPDGRFRVRIDGRETTAASQQPLQPGGRYVVQLDRTPNGVVLRPLPDSPKLPATVATTILRTDKPPPLGDTLPSLVKELSLPAPRAEATPIRGANGDVQKVAAEVREVAVKLLPSPDQPPTAERIRQLVEDGGTHFEAKLARSADSPDRPAPPAPHTDLKGGLLSLARTVSDLAAAFPAAAATLDGIERQQAVNVLAQQNGGMAVFQIPFPDGTHWRTLGLGIEPDRGGERDSSGRPTGFRVMMHVPLTSLGETWIDASAESHRLRAVLYVSDAAARERVRAELPELRRELQAGGFGEVLLDVRPAGDLTDSQRRKANAIREGVPEGGGLLDCVC